MAQSDEALFETARRAAHEVWFEFTRSPGPGGQHANKTSTRAVACFSVPGSRALDEEQQRRIASKLRNRIDSDGVLRVASAESRSQSANRQAATGRFAALVVEALRRPKRRRRTRPPRAAVERRLQQKRRRGEVKRGRGSVGREDG